MLRLVDFYFGFGVFLNVDGIYKVCQERDVRSQNHFLLATPYFITGLERANVFSYDKVNVF